MNKFDYNINMKKNFVLFGTLFIFLFACMTNKDVVEPATTTTSTTTTTIQATVEVTTTSTTTTTTTTTLQPVDKRLQFSFNDVQTHSDLERKIRNLFLAIEDIISNKDFDSWYAALSSNYKAFLNDTTELEKLSQKSQYLINKKKILKTPQDYFNLVVITAREGQKLEYRGYKKINNQSLIVYNGIAGYDMDYQYKFVYEKDAWRLDK